MTPRQRLLALVREHQLAESSLPALTTLIEALASSSAPTSVNRASQAVDVHVADSLAALAFPGFGSARRVADLGSGAGLPGLALAAALPAAHFSLIESNARKCVFIGETSEAMGLANTTVVNARVEDWRAGMESQDIVCARALASLPVLLEYAAPLLRPRGALIAWKGRVEEVEAADGEAAALALGLGAASVLPVRPFASSERRTLHVFAKTGETPSRYPRRAGMAAKRPLRAST